jgi:hypothetical protein
MFPVTNTKHTIKVRSFVKNKLTYIVGDSVIEVA